MELTNQTLFPGMFSYRPKYRLVMIVGYLSAHGHLSIKNIVTTMVTVISLMCTSLHDKWYENTYESLEIINAISHMHTYTYIQKKKMKSSEIRKCKPRYTPLLYLAVLLITQLIIKFYADLIASGTLRWTCLSLLPMNMILTWYSTDY